MAKPAHLAIDWTHVLDLAIDDRSGLANAHLFSLDMGSVITVNSVTQGTEYKLDFTSLNETVSVIAVAEDTPKTIAEKLIEGVNNHEALKYFVTALAAPSATEKSLRKYLWIGAKKENELEIRSLLPFTFYPVSGTPALTGLKVYQNAVLNEPIRLGGRSVILNQVCNRTLVYKKSIDLPWMQANLAAHFATQNMGPSQGMGSLSTDSWEGESMSFTMPTNNPKSHQERHMTIFGKRWVELTRGKKVKIRMNRRR